MAFANITCYSIGAIESFGANCCVMFLLLCSIPISFLLLNISNILLPLHQDPNITRMAHTYLIFSLPNLPTHSFLHPIRIYLRAQGVTHPITLASLAGTLLHFPFNYLLVRRLRRGLAGVAAASAASSLSILLFLATHVCLTGLRCAAPTRDCLSGLKPLLRLAAPSCVSVCLEWWWYEIMIVLCGLLALQRWCLGGAEA
ncbi:hypothetical protein VIGAN_04131200 [Vigna angularis var. angularis]|uniref:Uncharacterized protein n=1 Tax=Vigna angularis var. angularis TaxID=157739 RepID=A0A0S3RU00_PHAAN|nr:protein DETOXIFICATION 51-like [Vigna angularis]BAT84046.1 hypothetical protein VIGAN_04131200 [Vigna angularis var. angularis]